MKKLLKDELSKLGEGKPKLLFPEHHLSHAASAFYPSPFDQAAILTIDGVGEWATTTIGKGLGNRLSVLRELHFPHSLGMLYSAFTYYTGFRVNSGEYKLMGLAPYGHHLEQEADNYRKLILDHLVDIRPDGSIFLNMKYFEFATGLKMTNDKRWEALFGFPPRKPESEINNQYIALAYAIQLITEDIVMKLAQTAKELTGMYNLVMAGGVALNSVANGKVLRSRIFDDLWIQPAAGDAGGALGAALAARHIFYNKSRVVAKPDSMKGALLGPAYSDKYISRVIGRLDADYQYIDDFGLLVEKTAALIDQGNVIGWFQGRMEFGPRALGNRSILGDARNPEMQRRMNLKIKNREGFRPFAPAVLEEDVNVFFELQHSSPYMLFVVPVQEDHRFPEPQNFRELTLFEKLYHQRSDIPAVTHIDYSARLQTVSEEQNPRFHQLLSAFKRLTGCSVVINTSFNVRGEPIVCSPEEAYRCFMRTEMDYLVIGNYFFDKKKQPSFRDEKKLVDHFDPD